MKEYHDCVCFGPNGKPKRKYMTRKAAKIYAKNSKLRRGYRFRPYPCPGGVFWHLTSDGEYKRSIYAKTNNTAKSESPS